MELSVEWARKNEHSADPVIRSIARRILRAHYLRGDDQQRNG